jgi:hypothetical protein
LNLDKHQHRGQHAHSEENAIGRQLIAEVKAIAGGLGSQKVHHLLLLAGKYVLRNLDLGITDEVSNTWLANVIPSASSIARAPVAQLRVEVVRLRDRFDSQLVFPQTDHGHRHDKNVPPCVEGKQLVSSLKTMVDRQKCCEALSISLPPTGERYHASLRLIKLYCVVNQQYQADSRKPHDATKWKHWVHNAAATIDVDLLELEDISVDALNVNEILGD